MSNRAKNDLKRAPTYASIASIVLFAVCLLGHGYYLAVPDPEAQATAWQLFLVGWMGFFAGVFTWLANPVLLLSWILYFIKQPRLSLIASIAAISIMLSFLFKTTIIYSERPDYSQIVGYGMGFWLWIASAGLQVFGSLGAVVRSRIGT